MIFQPPVKLVYSSMAGWLAKWNTHCLQPTKAIPAILTWETDCCVELNYFNASSAWACTAAILIALTYRGTDRLACVCVTVTQSRLTTWPKLFVAGATGIRSGDLAISGQTLYHAATASRWTQWTWFDIQSHLCDVYRKCIELLYRHFCCIHWLILANIT